MAFIVMCFCDSEMTVVVVSAYKDADPNNVPLFHNRDVTVKSDRDEPPS
jgi:hypothetical protein